MTMLIAANLQNRIICASDTRISIENPDGTYGEPTDHFYKNVHLNANILFMGAGSVQTNCSLVQELIKICGTDDHIQDLLEKLNGQSLTKLVMEIQKTNNTYGVDDSVTFVLVGMNTDETQEFNVEPVLNRIQEAQDLTDDEFFLDEGIKVQLETLGAQFSDQGPDLSKVARDARIIMPELHRSTVVKFDVRLGQSWPTIQRVYYEPFQVCVVAPSAMPMSVEQLANETIYAVGLSKPKPKFVEELVNSDATNLLSRFKLLSELGQVDDVVNGGLIFAEVLPDKIVVNDGKLWRQKPSEQPELLSDTKVINRKLHIYSKSKDDYVPMMSYREPFDEKDYHGGKALAGGTARFSLCKSHSLLT